MMFVRREFTFSAAHRIDLGGGKSEGLHGHNYGLVVTVEGEPDEYGMVLDFRLLKEIVEREVLSELDHSYLNEILKQPTAENLAVYVWNRLDKALRGSNYRLYQVEIYESPESSVIYRRETP